MSVAIPPAAGDADLIHNPDDGVEPSGGAPVCGFGEHEPCLSDLCGLRYAGASFSLVTYFPPAAVAIGSVDDFVHGRESADAGDHAIVVFDTNQRAEERDTVDEGLCAVDGIDDPAVAISGRCVGEFFAEDPVVGETEFQLLADEQFGAAIGDGDRRLIGLGFHKQSVSAVVLQNELAG